MSTLFLLQKEGKPLIMYDLEIDTGENIVAGNFL